LTMSPKTKRRTQKDQERDKITILKWFRKGDPIPSGYEAVNIKEFRKIAKSTLKRDIRELEDYNWLQSKIGSRNAKSYSLTPKGLLVGLKKGAFSPEEMRQVRLKNDIEIPPVLYPIPAAASMAEIKTLTKTMEELKPRLFYEIIYKFDLEAFPENMIGAIWMLAGLCTMVIVYTLEPEEIITKLKGTKAAKTLKEGKLPRGFLVLLSICLPLIPKEMQTEIVDKMKEVGIILPKFSLKNVF
jgi:hypothetical protein